jgi:serine/threonine protein kinase
MNAIPRNLGRYELRAPLGRGGAGEVWRAFDAQNQRVVAIKIFHPDLWQSDPHFLTRFRREGQVLTSLQNDHLVQIRDANIDRPAQSNETAAYLVMDYVDGQTLADYIHLTSHKGIFPPVADIVYLFTCLGLAVDYLHQAGITHGDIKPRNILLNKQNTTRFEGGEPLLSEAGLGRIVGEQVTIADPFYISPEQARGAPANRRSDIYALGVILYEICTGVQPFRAESSVAIMQQHINALPTPPALINPHVPNALSEVILRALAKDPATRFSSASGLAAAIADACSPQPALYALQDEEDSGTNTHDQPILGVAQPLTHSQSRTPAVRPQQRISPNIRLGDESSRHMPTVSSSFSTEQGPKEPQVGSFSTSSTAAFPTSSMLTSSGQIPAVSPPPFLSPNAYSPASPIQGARSIPLPPPPRNKGSEVPLRVVVIALLLLLLVIGSVAIAGLLYANKQQTAAANSVPQVFFQDDAQGQGMDDQLRVNLPNAGAPPSGQVYFAWIRTTAGKTMPLGPLTMQNQDATLLYQGDAGHTDLLTEVQGILVTLENAGSTPKSPTGQSVYQGSFDTKVLTDLKNVLYVTPHLPGQQSSVRGLLSAIQSINEKAGSIVDSLHTDPALVHRQAVRIIEIVDGTAYARSNGDLPADVQAQLNTPMGLVSSPSQPGYLDALDTSLTQLKQDAGNNNTSLLQHLQNVQNSTTDLHSWVKTIHDNAVKILNMQDLNTPAADSTALQLQRTAADAYTGRTIPPNQGPAPTLGSAGAYQAYVEAQYMAALNLQKM